MNSIILCIFVFCTLQVISLPTTAQHEDILNEYLPIFMKLNGIYGGIANGAQNTRYVYRTLIARTFSSLTTKANYISTEKIENINQEIESLTEYCRFESVKEKCLRLKDLDIGNFTIKAKAGFEACRQVYGEETAVYNEYIDEITNEVSRIYHLEETVKQNCIENISSDDKLRLCLFQDLYSNVLPPLNKLKNHGNFGNKLKTLFDIAEDDVNNCYSVAEEVVVEYYAMQIANNFKYCCIYGN